MNHGATMGIDGMVGALLVLGNLLALPLWWWLVSGLFRNLRTLFLGFFRIRRELPGRPTGRTSTDNRAETR